MKQLLKSRAGVALLAFLAAGGFLLAYEHRVHLFTGNGILFGLLAACIGMHLFMHGGHGSHGDGHGHNKQDSVSPDTDNQEK